MSSPVDASRDASRLSLRNLAITGAGWTLLSFGGQNALRLVSNVILSRLLFPEAFGLMALVSVTLEALELFSDVGLRQSVVANRRGADPHFLHTVWTVQIVRGAGIFVVALALAGPVARFYGESQLDGLIAVASLTALLRGFTSAGVHLLARELELRRMTFIELGTQVASIVGMTLYAWIHPTLWVLPVGAVVGRALYCAASHAVMPGPRMRLAWDPVVRAELVGFGRWILVSSILGYLVNSLDRLTLGYSMSMAELGAYNIALMMVRIPLMVQRRLRNEVMYPVIVRMREEPADRSHRTLVRARLGILVTTHPALVVLAIFGPELIRLLYDARYAGAGWMLQVLSAGFLFKTTIEPSDAVFLARQDSFQYMLLLAVRSGVLIAGMGAAGWAYGPAGVVWAVAFAEVLAYPAFVWCIRGYGAWLPVLDWAAPGAALLCVGLGIYLKQL